MDTYIIYHPGTGTILNAKECVLVDTSQLPDDPEVWEDYLASNSGQLRDTGELT